MDRLKYWTLVCLEMQAGHFLEMIAYFEQCEQMAALFVRVLAIYDNENYPYHK